MAGTSAALPVEPVSEAVLALPLGTRKLVGAALDLLTRPDSGLRSASFYLGLLVLVTIAPIVILAGLAATLNLELFDPFAPSPLDGPLIAATFLALAGYFVAGIEARALATAVIGGRAEGRPLRMPESIAIARRRFWKVLVASLVVGVATVDRRGGHPDPDRVPAGQRPGDQLRAVAHRGDARRGAVRVRARGHRPGRGRRVEAIQRSMRLAFARKRLAVVVAIVRDPVPVHRPVRPLDRRRCRRPGRRRDGCRGGVSARPRHPPRGRARVRVRHAPAVPRRGDHRGARRVRVRGADALHARAPGGSRPADQRPDDLQPWLTPGLAVAAIAGLVLVVGAIAGLTG